jgi:hypothetical protein
MTDTQKNEQPEPEPENRDEEPIEDRDPKLLPEGVAPPMIGGETHGLGPPVP